MQKRPGRFLTAQWLDLAKLNYEIDPTILSKRLPAGTELDTWNGKTFISVVGFRFLGTRVFGMSIPLHRNFEEVNLRFYVRRASPEGVRRGVVFIKEIVPRTVIAWVARRVYNENYVALPMRHQVALTQQAGLTTGGVTYQWWQGSRWHRLALHVDGMASLPAEDSEEAFITEHYWGYVMQRHGATLEYQVEHRRWHVWQAEQVEFDCDVAAIYGAEFVPFLRGSPASAFVADGSAVAVRRGIEIREHADFPF